MNSHVFAQLSIPQEQIREARKLILSHKTMVSLKGVSSEKIKEDLLLQSSKNLADLFRIHPSSDPQIGTLLQDFLHKSRDEQKEIAIEIQERLRYDVQSPIDRNPKFDAVCKYLQLTTWDCTKWDESLWNERLSGLDASLLHCESTGSQEHWLKFAEQLEGIRDNPVTSGLAEKLASLFRCPNVIVSIPVKPLQSVHDRSLTRSINEVKKLEKFSLHAEGVAKINYDAGFIDYAGTGHLRLTLSGQAHTDLQMMRNRISLNAIMKTHLGGYIDIPLTLNPKESVNLTIENELTFQCADFKSRVPVVSRLIEAQILRIADKKAPMLQSSSEGEMELGAKQAIGNELNRGIGETRDLVTKFVEKSLVEKGVSLSYKGCGIDKNANFNFNVDTSYGAQRLPDVVFPEEFTSDQFVVFISEALVNQFADAMRGARMRETDIRELCFEPLGLVPEFESSMVAVQPYSIQLSNANPFKIKMHSHRLELGINFDSFDGGDGDRFGPFRLVTNYRVEFDNKTLRLIRTGPVTISDSSGRYGALLQNLADRLFPVSCSSSDISLVDQLAKGTGLSIERVRIEDRWLAIHVQYDANDLIKRLFR